MNKQTGKLLILGGFGTAAAISAFNILTYLFRIQFSPIISGGFQILNILSWLAIILGFGILFLASRKIIDLIIAGGFALSLFVQLLTGLSTDNSFSVLYNGKAVAGVVVIIRLIVVIAYLLWAIKLFKRLPIGSIIIIAAVAVSVLLPWVVVQIIAPGGISVLLLLLINLFCALGPAAVAFLDYNN